MLKIPKEHIDNIRGGGGGFGPKGKAFVTSKKKIVYS